MKMIVFKPPAMRDVAERRRLLQKSRLHGRAGASTAAARRHDAWDDGCAGDTRFARSASLTTVPLPSLTVPLSSPGLVVELASEAAWGMPVGGDFYDSCCLADGSVALILGDVCGHGLAAAQHVPAIKLALRLFLAASSSPAQALRCLNTWLCGGREGGLVPVIPFVTVALIVLDSRTGFGSCCLAGAEPPLILRHWSHPEPIEALGMALGVLTGEAFEDAAFAETTFHLGPDDLLLLMTDGILEARSGDAFLGLDGALRLAQAAVEAPEAPSPRIVSQTILDGVRRFTGGLLPDDASVLTVGRRPSSTQAITPALIPERKSR